MALRFFALTLAVVLAAVPAAGKPSRPLVGHVMALLAVFEQAETLPPETSPEANALIHALIQTQAALTKSANPAARKWFADALHRSHPPGAEPTLQDGLTSRALEAILSHAVSHPPSERPEVMAGLMEFNVRQDDLDLLARVYWNARNRIRSAGRDIHSAYEAQRQTMPFR